MTVALLWMLIALSDGGYNKGTPVTIGYFVKQDQCEKVKSSLIGLGSEGSGFGSSRQVKASCVQVETVVVK